MASEDATKIATAINVLGITIATSMMGVSLMLLGILLRLATLTELLK